MTSSAPRGARAHRVAPAVLHLLLVLAVVAPVLLGAPFAAPASADVEPTDDEVTVTLTQVAPASLTPGSTLRVTATVANGTTDVLEEPVAVLGSERTAIATRSTLEGWATADASAWIGETVEREELDPLAPGETTEVTFSVPAATLGLTAASDWGPRGIAVRLSDGFEHVAVQRSFVVWAPSSDVPTVQVGLVAAVTGPAVDPDPEEYTDALSAATGEEGRLGRLLEATQDVPEVGWVVDPALLAAAQASPDPATATWADRAVAATSDRSTFALHAYDPDVAAYAHAGLALPQDTPLPRPEGTTTGAEAESASWRTDLAWPADPVPDLETAALAASSGATTLVVGGEALVPDGRLTYTPTGSARVATAGGDLTALVPDPVVTGLVAAGAGTDPVTTQRLLAETSVIARERPAEQRTILVALPRTWEPDTASFTTRVEALRAASWVDLVTVDDVLDARVPDVPRDPLPETTPADDEISAAQLRSLDRTRRDLAAFATVAADPAALTRSLETGFVTPSAVAYRTSTDARTRAVVRAEQAARTVMDGVSILRGSSILLLAEEQSLPIRVSNELGQDVEVQVVLRPDDSRLKAPSRPVATVPARSEVTVMVPVEAAGSVNVVVDVEAVSAARPDVRVAEPQQFVVRVRADWESVGTVVVGALLAVAMLGGIWRTVRRGKSPHRVAGAAVDQPAPPVDAEQRS